MKAFDVSNYWQSGPVTDEEARAMLGQAREEGFKRIIAGTQRPSVCYQQLSIAQSFGFELAAYVQVDWSASLVSQFSAARYAIDTLPVKNLAITVEAPANSFSELMFTPKLLSAAIAQAKKFNFKNVVIYTNWDNWHRLMDDSEAFRSYPLWYAHYDGLANVESAHAWREDGFGGWWEPYMKQFSQNQLVAGMNVDLDDY